MSGSTQNGDGNDNLLTGGAFNDSLSGLAGRDTLVGGAGDDTLDGGAGNDTLIGGDGIDWASYANATGGVTVDLTRVDNFATQTSFDGTSAGAEGNDSLLGIENVIGGAGNDRIFGNTSANMLLGGDGNDLVSGLNGAISGVGRDTLLGGNGDDILFSAMENNSVSGGIGNDSLFKGRSGFNDTLIGGEGTDQVVYIGTQQNGIIINPVDYTIDLANGFAFININGAVNDSLVGIENVTVNDGNDSILGDSQANLFDGGNGNDALSGADGNDSLIGGGGNDTLIGGADTDLASYAAAMGAVTVDLTAGTSSGAAGNDRLTGIENILGGNGNDSILGDSLANVLDGGLGNDTIVGSIGDDTLYGGGGIDVADFRGFGATVTVNLLQGIVFDEGGTSQFSGFERILSDGGQATLERGDGGDTFIGGSANDLVIGDTGNDEMSGGLGDDSFDGGNGNDTIITGDGNDSVGGGIGNDRLEGGNFNDTFQGGPGNDTFIGGSGRDLVDYSYVTGHGVTVSLQDESAYGGSEDDLIGIEDVNGTGQDDELTGDSNDNLINGLGGNDSILGLASNDTLDGGNDDDTLLGGEGEDRLEGGDGNDFASYAGAAAGVDVQLTGGGNGNALGGAGNDGLVSIEGLIGSIHNDTLFGDNGANTILGGEGVDTLSGGAGNDWLDFGTGNENYLRDPTDSGSDTLIGGDGGADTLDLGSDWSYMTLDGAYSLYQDQTDTIYAQGWETVVCFAEGTRIVTPNGEDAVENLRAGDMVLAMRDGQAGFEPLRWVGFMDVAVPRNAAMAAKTAPILIKAGALAAGMPARDLRVSPDHAMELDGHLIPAKHLVNGSSIIQETWCRRVRYFHLELEAHGLLLSEGTWSESYLDDGNRHAFNNAAMTGLFLDFEAGRSIGQYDHQACLPVLRQGLKLDEIHGRLALRAEATAQPEKGRRRG
jgi:Ca2+-binding RTX toxin-like protein